MLCACWQYVWLIFFIIFFISLIILLVILTVWNCRSDLILSLTGSSWIMPWIILEGPIHSTCSTSLLCILCKYSCNSIMVSYTTLLAPHRTSYGVIYLLQLGLIYVPYGSSKGTFIKQMSHFFVFLFFCKKVCHSHLISII